MKIVQINATGSTGSTGKICTEISKLLTEERNENYIICAKKTPTDGDYVFPVSNKALIKANALISRITGLNGLDANLSTRRVIKLLDKIKPDIVHIHNIHNHFVNFEVLINYLKNNKIKVVWTFHDCWAYTGYCMYYDACNCKKWETECGKCPQRKQYSWFFDNSKKLQKTKKQAIAGLDLTIVTPSQWLAGEVKQSFLKDYPVKVINNGIDLSVFKPTESNFREEHSIPKDKFILLGVAFGWGKRKGLDVFIELSKRLNDDFQIVLVGTDDAVDKQLPDNIISIHKTNNQTELAEIYTAADLFVNPTREDNFPTVNIESLACGTPVLTFRTGGSPEAIDDTCGSVVVRENIDALEREIIRIKEEKPYSKEKCMKRASSFEAGAKFKEYIELYKDTSK